jgi:hypothetical protein
MGAQHPYELPETSDQWRGVAPLNTEQVRMCVCMDTVMQVMNIVTVMVCKLARVHMTSVSGVFHLQFLLFRELPLVSCAVDWAKGNASPTSVVL